MLNVPDHWDLLEDVVERFQPGEKLVILPKLFLGKTLEKGKHPHQDAQILFTLRNYLVHYKLKIYAEKYANAAKTLADRKVAFPLSVSGTPLVDRVSTVNGIHWAYNTAVATIKTLIAMLPDDGHIKGGYEASYAQIKEISEEDMKAMAL